MKRELLISPTAGMTKEMWLKYRVRGLGASDVGTIFGYNQYKHQAELFYEKLEPNPQPSVESISQFMGHYDEPSIAELWQYWAGTEESMMKNYWEGKIIRKCQRVNAYVTNPKYPWLYCSLDRKINKGDRGEEGALEIKTIAGYQQSKWDTGIPPSHLVQVITQMLICEFPFGELATRADGRKFNVWAFEYNPVIGNNIIERTKAFWDKVVQGRIIKTQIYEATANHNMRLVNDLQAELQSLEPEPDGSEAYEKFMKPRFKKSIAEIGLVMGTDADMQLAIKHSQIKEQMKKLEDDAREMENRLKRRIGDGVALDFGNSGRVSWKGNPKTFRNLIKK